jgi:hypothetical protein
MLQFPNQNASTMNMRVLLWIAVVVCLLGLGGCSKQGPVGPAGATGPAGPAGPAGPQGDANVTSVIFTNVIVPLNGTYTFNIPAITQAVLDSGTVTVWYSNPSITPETWIALPQYYFYNGSLVWVILDELQLGKATLSDNGISPYPFTYRFDIIAAN